MELEYWWLLALPLFFALGWIAARIDIKQLVSESRALPMSYFKGLNFLLNEQPDKAIEAFIEVVKVDPQTVELHFALGSLFRRRGELERAIRMHQNLVERPDLAAGAEARGALRARAGLSQGGAARPRGGAVPEARRHAARGGRAQVPARDLPAGKGLAEGDRRRREARIGDRPLAPEGDRELLLRARERRDDALAARRPRSRISTRRSRTIACACARTCCWAISSSRSATPTRRSKRGSASRRRTPRTSRSSRSASSTRLQRPGAGGGGAEPAARLPREVSVARRAERRVPGDARAAGRRSPRTAWCATSCGASRRCSASTSCSKRSSSKRRIERRRDLELIRGLVNQHTQGLAMYRCDNCGFRARQYYWHCPACGTWETYSPRRTEEKGGAGVSMTDPKVIVALDFADAKSALDARAAARSRAVPRQGGQGALHRGGPGARRRSRAARLRRVSRSQVPRHSEHGRGGVPRRRAARRVDAQRARVGRQGDAASAAREAIPPAARTRRS